MILAEMRICEYSILFDFFHIKIMEACKKMTYHIDVADSRTKILKNLLKNRGFDADVYSPGKIQNIKPSDTLVFSPAKKICGEEASSLPGKITVVCGNLSDGIANVFAEKQISHRNIMKSEEFAVKNALLTAEGVLALILEKSVRSINENKILILGNGRIATALAVLLGKIGARFALVAYDVLKVPKLYILTDRVYHGNDFFAHINKYDIIVNTIPAKIFSSGQMALIAQNTVLIETASVPCLDKAEAGHFYFVDAPGLPQKYSAESAAKLMMEYILGERL